MAQRRHARALRAAKSAMSYARHRDATYTSIETGMLEWINHMLRHEWRAVLGPKVDEQARETLEHLVKSTGGSASSVVKRAKVEAFTLGVVPPDLRLYVSRFNPTEDYLQLEFDMNWHTVSSHILINATVRPVAFLPAMTVPVHITDFSISGRLIVGFRLVQRAPGVSGVDVSFEKAPDLDVSIRPAGLPVNDLPGVHEYVMRKIGSMFAAKYVEPRRFFKDLETMYLAGGVGGEGVGPGGALVVDVAGATRLPATNRETRTSNPYLELMYAGITRRTATRLNTISPDWSHRLVFPLPAAPPSTRAGTGVPGGKSRRGGNVGGFGNPMGSSGDVDVVDEAGRTHTGSGAQASAGVLQLRVKVMDWSPLGEPRCIGTATYAVDVARLQRAAAANSAGKSALDAAKAGGPLALTEVFLPLRGTRGGSVKLFVGAAPPPSSGVSSGGGIPLVHERQLSSFEPIGGGDRVSGAGLRMSNLRHRGRETTASQGMGNGGSYDSNDDSQDSKSDDDDDALLDESDGEDSKLDESDAEDGVDKTPPRAPSGASKFGVVAGARSNTADARKAGANSAAVSHLLQVAKIQKERREERSRHAEEKATTARTIHTAHEDLEMERERRRFELRRALIEGAVFSCHTKRKPGFEPGTYRLWYSSTKRQMMWSAGASATGKSKLHQFVPVSLIKECVVGTSAFTLGAQSEHQQRKSAPVSVSAAIFKSRSPSQTAFASARAMSNMVVAKKIGNHDPLRCFSLVLWRPESTDDTSTSVNVLTAGAAGLGLQSVDLELPEGGNGRSVREWCDAITAAAVEHGGGKNKVELMEEREEKDAHRAGAQFGAQGVTHEASRRGTQEGTQEGTLFLAGGKRGQLWNSTSSNEESINGRAEAAAVAAQFTTHDVPSTTLNGMRDSLAPTSANIDRAGVHYGQTVRGDGGDHSDHAITNRRNSEGSAGHNLVRHLSESIAAAASEDPSVRSVRSELQDSILDSLDEVMDTGSRREHVRLSDDIGHGLPLRDYEPNHT
jgi:hypothetical protein